MTFNLVYGLQLQSIFLDCGEAIAADVVQKNYFVMSQKLNQAFFGGGTIAPKSMRDLASIVTPYCRPELNKKTDNLLYIIIARQYSFSAVLGYVEGIPLIGSAIAAIKALFHLFGMLLSCVRLKKAVVELQSKPRNMASEHDASSLQYTMKVFAAAMDFTVHQNHLIASALSLIPLLKPIVRVAQAIIYNALANHATLAPTE